MDTMEGYVHHTEDRRPASVRFQMGRVYDWCRSAGQFCFERLKRSGWLERGNDALGDGRAHAAHRWKCAAKPEDLMDGQVSSLREALNRGRTLPAEWYTDAKLFEREKEHIFAASWNYVGRVEHVAKAGDFLTGRVGEVPVVIVRDDTGTLRAYANVCRHRGSELVLEKCGNRRTLQCHYHAWTWGLDGALRSPALPGAGRIQQGRLPAGAAGSRDFRPLHLHQLWLRIVLISGHAGPVARNHPLSRRRH